MIEFVGFVVINAYYIERDGNSRFFAGEYASPMPLALVVAGVVSRTVVQLLHRRFGQQSTN
jgi:hypothetical protein